MADAKPFSHLNDQDVGNRYTYIVLIDKIRQTRGPTLFFLSDGQNILKTTAFTSAGVRSYPVIKPGDTVEVDLLIKKRLGSIEAEILRLKKITGENGIRLASEMLASNPDMNDIALIVNSASLEKMKPVFKKIASRLRRAVQKHHPLIIRHHDDCDGYAGGIAIERALLPLLSAMHGTQVYQLYRRIPNRTPYYDYADTNRDLNFFHRGAKNPLLVLIDFGGTAESLVSLRKMDIYNVDIMVIDHHDPGPISNGKPAIAPFVKEYVNPHLFGSDSEIVAGMLSAEIARFINPDVVNIKSIPALAGVGDKSSKNEFRQYLEVSGHEESFLKKLALCIDFEAHFQRYGESRTVMNDLFFENPEKQLALMDMLTKEISLRFRQMELAVKKYHSSKKIHNTLLIMIDCQKVMYAGGFPNSSKVVSLTHDLYDEPRITLGISPEMIIFRADGVPSFSANKIIQKIKDSTPHALIGGGGHAFAGALRFTKIAQEEVLNKVLEEIRATVP